MGRRATAPHGYTPCYRNPRAGATPVMTPGMTRSETRGPFGIRACPAIDAVGELLQLGAAAPPGIVGVELPTQLPPEGSTGQCHEGQASNKCIRNMIATQACPRLVKACFAIAPFIIRQVY